MTTITSGRSRRMKSRAMRSSAELAVRLIGARQVHQADGLPLESEFTGLLLDRLARPVAHVLVQASQHVEHRGLAHIGLSSQGHRAAAEVPPREGTWFTGFRPGPPPARSRPRQAGPTRRSALILGHNGLRPVICAAGKKTEAMFLMISTRTICKTVFFSLLCMCFWVLPSLALDFTRGPFVQNASTNRIQIIWQTSEPIGVKRRAAGWWCGCVE